MFASSVHRPEFPVDIFSTLGELRILYQRFDHPAVFTCEESEALNLNMPGHDTKNLFLCDEKKKQCFVVSMGHEKSVDLKQLSQVLGVKGLRFGSGEKLKEYLGVEPGSVTLLGVINDQSNAVQVVIDQKLWEADALQCHPLVNTATLVIPHEGMEKFFKETKHEPRIIDVPGR